MSKKFTINVTIDDYEIESTKEDYSEEIYKEHCEFIQNIYKSNLDYFSFATPQGKVFIPGVLLKKAIITLKVY